jgi:hypothetical protein
MIKQLVLITVVLMSAGLVSAGEIVKINHETVFLYGQVEDNVRMTGAHDEKTNYNKTICINSTAIEGEISISNDDPYELEYTFIADINDSSYISRIVIMEQEVTSSSFITGKLLNRTLTIDGIEIANYETKYSWFGGLKKDTFYFCLMDNNIRYGDDIYNNISIAFTQLNYQDQQDMIPDYFNAKKQASHFYVTVGVDSEQEDGLKLSGLTGWAYNAIGTISLWNIGNAIQGFIYMPLTIIQYTINFLFSFLFLIINNWWYALLLLEIFCIIPALQYKDYPSMVSKFIDMHVKIFDFMYHKVILPLIAQLLRLIEIIRNMFRI